MSEQEVTKARLYLELTLDADKTIQHACDNLNQKIKAIFSTACTLVPIVAGLGYFILKEKYSQTTLVLVVISLICFFISIAIGFSLHGPSDFRYMDASEIFKEYKDKPLRFLINKSASTLADITVHNSSILNSCELSMKLMLGSIILGLLFVAIAFLVLGIKLG